jgi:hypothetical protein
MLQSLPAVFVRARPGESVRFRNEKQIARDTIKRPYDYTNGGETPAKPAAPQNIDCDEKLTYPCWRYIDIPFPQDDIPPVQPIAPNAKAQIEALREMPASAAATGA